MPTACITGASSGIGKEFAAQLAARGYNLILVARNTKALEELAAELACKCRIISCDLSKEAQCMQLAEELKPLDIQILINNAGFGDLDRFAQSDLSKSLDMINVNIKALHILTRKLLPELMKKRPRLHFKCCFQCRTAARRTVYVYLLRNQGLRHQPDQCHLSGITGSTQQCPYQYALSWSCQYKF